MEYIKYADDCFAMIFVSGSLKDAKFIQSNIKDVLKTNCGLKLNQEKQKKRNNKQQTKQKANEPAKAPAKAETTNKKINKNKTKIISNLSKEKGSLLGREVKIFRLNPQLLPVL
jgi:hypothetical protein